MIKVLIVDDQQIILQGLTMVLGRERDIDIIDVASNGEEAVNKCKIKDVDIVLMDIQMPCMHGVEATKQIMDLEKNIKVIVLTTFIDETYIFDSLKNGASGYLLKDAKPAEIIEAIRTVYNGESLISPKVAIKVVNQFTRLANEVNSLEVDKRVELLTSREKDICHLLSEGKNNKEISKTLYLSEGTIKNHITNILNKLELRDRTQLAIFSVKNRL